MANKYLHATSGTGNWSDGTGTWTTTDQGATATSAPTTSDVAICTVNAGARTLTVDTTTCVAQQLNCTGFVGTLAIGASNQLSITTNITFGSGMTFTSSGRLRAGAGTATLNFNGVAIAGDFEFFGTGTKTLSANVTVSGITYLSANPTVNTNTWYAVGGVESNTTTGRYFYGSANLELRGGRLYYITKRTGGILILNGNVTLQSGYATSTMGIYDSTLRYTSGTITVATDSIFNVNGTSTIESNVGSNIIFEHLDTSGTCTIGSDIYIAKKLSCIGATSWTINGAYTVHVGYGGGSGADLIMYNLGTFISTTAKISFEGTGRAFNGTSYNGMTFYPLSALQIDVDINTPGTITFETGSANRWGGGRTLTYVAGTIVLTNCSWEVLTGGYVFNVNNAFTVPTFTNTATMTTTFSTAFTATTMNLETGSTTNAIGNLTATTLRMNGSAVLTKPNDDTVINVTTNFIQNGTDALTPTVVASPITVTEFMGGIATTMSSDVSSVSATRRISFPQIVDQYTFSIAFDIKYNGYTGNTLLGQGDGYLWFPASPFTTRFYFYLTPGDAYYCTHGMQTGGVVNNRVVITKSLGSAMKFYVNGTQKTTSYTGSSATLLNEDFNFSTFMGQVTGDVLFFQTEVDSTWVAADYAKFTANGNSSNMQYDNTEPNLFAGWHVDSFDNSVTNMNLKYDGTLLASQLFQGAFNYVDASTSAVPILTYNGSQNNSTNVYAITGENFKPYAVATA